MARAAPSAGGDLGRRGHQLRRLRRGGRRRRPGPVRPDRGRAAAAPARGHRPHLARLRARGRPRPALRLPGPRRLRPGAGGAPQPGQAPARPLRAGRRGDGRLGRVGVRLPGRRRRPAPRRPRLEPARAQVGGGPRHLPVGRGPPPERALGGHGHLRGPRARVHHAPPGRAAAPAGQLRGHGLGPGGGPPPAPRRDHPGAAAGPPVRVRAPPGPDGADQLLGLQLDRLLRPRGPLLLHRDQGPAGERVQGDGPQPPRGRDRGDPGRRLQPHRRGQPHGPDAVVPGPRQPLLLPDGGLQPALLHGLHRHRQHPQRPPSPGAGPDHGLAALLGRGDARRRLPLRPGLAPWPAASTRSTGCRPSST